MHTTAKTKTGSAEAITVAIDIAIEWGHIGTDLESIAIATIEIIGTYIKATLI